MPVARTGAGRAGRCLHHRPGLSLAGEDRLQLGHTLRPVHAAHIEPRRDGRKKSRIEIAGEIRKTDERLQRIGLAIGHAIEPVSGVLGPRAGDHPVERGAKPVNIGPGADIPPARGLLRGAVMLGADAGVQAGTLGEGLLGRAEIQQDRLALGGSDEDVRRLDIAVIDLPRMEIAERIDHGPGEGTRFFGREGCAARKKLVQAHAVIEGHGKIGRTAMIEETDHFHDIGVVEPGEDLSLLAEALLSGLEGVGLVRRNGHHRAGDIAHH